MLDDTKYYPTQYEIITGSKREGRFCDIYKAIDPHGRTVAVKECRLTPECQEQWEHILRFYLREIYTLNETHHHPHIVDIYNGIYLPVPPPDSVIDIPKAISMEYMEYTLHLLLIDNYPTPDHTKSWLHQIASALFWIHAKGFIHRDVQALSVFTNDGKLVKIGKMELSRQSAPSMTSNVGEAGYMAPEIRCQAGNNKTYTTKCDSYSLLVLGLKCFHNPVEVSEDFVAECVGQLKNKEDDTVSEELVDLFLRNLDVDPNKRNTMTEIMEELRRAECIENPDDLEDLS